ncbi:CLUMA_CG000842, isoform A [Clunio marinus]|uniref:CLUMA_CG000842, isoform A n=1 Tax=Clunio marinus TaxID=568069 RepID=A0A1J1HI40_9DIPT|nr:CLUMA_CG000842, isoform A [Clunio marinus]
MNEFISVVNKLQDALSNVYTDTSNEIHLPQIVVIGSQSAGKSSVIESIVGRSFLPRGTGIVTRRPLILQLIKQEEIKNVKCESSEEIFRMFSKKLRQFSKNMDNSNNKFSFHEGIAPTDDNDVGNWLEEEFSDQEDEVDEDEDELSDEWIEFLHNPEKKFTNYSDVCKEIERQTDIVAGKDKGISDEPISLKVYSPRVVNLTLVDLPGFTKVAVGDQPEDIEDQIKNMVMNYIDNPNSIVLAVTAANTDIATSEALKFAKQVDKNGERTVAVLTKLDLMDKGTDAYDILSGNVYEVKLGIIGVVNRSQQDIIDKKGIDDQLKSESEFFEENYPKLAKKSGTTYLASKLSRILISHIKKTLPDLRKRIKQGKLTQKKELELYGAEIIDKTATFYDIVNEFVNYYRKVIEGSSNSNIKIYRIIHEDFSENLLEIIPNIDEISKSSDIKSILEKSIRPKLFKLPYFDKYFEEYVSHFIEELRGPSLDCAEKVSDEMKSNVNKLGTESQIYLDRFPILYEKLFAATHKLIEKCLCEVRNWIEFEINRQLAYINFEHPDFDKISFMKTENEENLRPDEMGQKLLVIYNVLIKGENKNDKLTESEKKNYMILKELVTNYFSIVRKQIQDLVPKNIIFGLVNTVHKELKNIPTEILASTNGSYDFMEEPEDIKSKRKNIEKKLECEMLKIIANNLLLFGRGSIDQVRMVATKAQHAVDYKIQNEWKDAKPYEDIPALSKFQLTRRFLPGGKYYKKSFTEMHRLMRIEYGDIVKFPSVLGRPEMLMIFNVEDSEMLFRFEGQYPFRRILETLEHYRKTIRPEIYSEYASLFQGQHEKWHRTRTLVNPVLLKPATVKQYIPQVEEIAKEFVEMIVKKRDENNEVPAQFSDYANMWSMESITCITLNRRLGILNQNYHDENAEKLIKLIRQFFVLTIDFEVSASIWKYYETKGFKKLMDVYDGMTDIILYYVEKSIEDIKTKPPGGGHEESILEKLVKINKKVAVVMCADSMLAGVDTTSSAFIGILYCLAKNQDKQEKLREELRNILPEKNYKLTPENMQSMPYLRGVIKEGLRLYPPTAGNMRAAGSDIVLSGYRVPKETQVVMGTTLAHYDEKLFPRPKEFIPERWLKDNTDPQCPHSRNSHPFSFLPFGFGPRKCVGHRIAELEIEVLLTRIIRDYKVEWHYPDMKIRSVMVNIPDGDLKFKFTEV